MEETASLDKYIYEMAAGGMNDLEEIKEIYTNADTYLEKKIAIIRMNEIGMFNKLLKILDKKAKLISKIKAKMGSIETKESDGKKPDDSFSQYIMNKLFAWEFDSSPNNPRESFLPPKELQKIAGESHSIILTLTDGKGLTERYLLGFDKKFIEITGVWMVKETVPLGVDTTSINDIEVLLENLSNFLGSEYYGGKSVLVDLLTAFKNKSDQLNLSDFIFKSSK